MHGFSVLRSGQAFRYVVQVLLDYATIRGIDTQYMIAHGPPRVGRVVSYILAQFKAPVASQDALGLWLLHGCVE